jgi:hypothetical protein
MNSENCELLVKEFPELYSSLDFGCECGDGWFKLIHDLSYHIYYGCKNENIPMGSSIVEPWNFYLTQVKEKYGTLRVYCSVNYDWIDKLIEKAEELSETTCEVCGKEAILRKGPWLKVRCDDCNKTDSLP